jgi:Flp pilus assembly pilin Flp
MAALEYVLIAALIAAVTVGAMSPVGKSAGRVISTAAHRVE